MKRGNCQNVFPVKFFAVFIVLMLAMVFGGATSGNSASGQSPAQQAGQSALPQPENIAENAPCGKCGMFPAQFPQWHSQIIFKDSTMTPFDGCKCMFNFLFGMEQYDKQHSRDDVAVAWVKDFNSGSWVNATEAHYVVGSNMMGPMGKELIPFADKSAAMKFQQEQGGILMAYGDINPDVLKTLGMGGMKMDQEPKKMKM